MNNDITKNFEQFAEMMKSAMPAVKTNKNGFEIRTKVLDIAKDAVWQDYYARWGQFETSVSKENGELITEVKMPEVPGSDTVLEAAEKFYNFVSNSSKN